MERNNSGFGRVSATNVPGGGNNQLSQLLSVACENFQGRESKSRDCVCAWAFVNSPSSIVADLTCAILRVNVKTRCRVRMTS